MIEFSSLFLMNFSPCELSRSLAMSSPCKACVSYTVDANVWLTYTTVDANGGEMWQHLQLGGYLQISSYLESILIWNESVI